MGRILLVSRLTLRDLRRRPTEAALLVLAIVAATATMTLGLVMHGVTNHPYETTREATAGPDVVASVEPDIVGPNRFVPTDLSALEALADAPGVVDHSGPYPATPAELEVDGIKAETWAEGRDPAEASVEQPTLTQGRWVEEGGVVVEAAFADALDVGPGDQVTLNDRSFPVVGVAVTAAASYTDVCFGQVCSFFIGSEPPPNPEGPRPEATDGQVVTVDLDPPADDAGLVWLSRADTRSIAPAEETLSYALNLKLDDPAQAPAFVEAHSERTWSSPFLASWQDLRETYGELVQNTQTALVTFGWLLMLLATASVAVLVGGRMADQTRRVGLLKAVGGTPGFVAVVLLVEHMVLALVAAAMGLAIGWLAAPLLTDPGAGLLGSAGAPTLTPSTVGLVTGMALGVAAFASFVPAVRAAYTSTVHALADRARAPRRTRWLIALSKPLPVPLLLGLRVIARKPRRVLLGIASTAVTVAGLVVVVTARAATAADWEGSSRLDPQADRANQVLLLITVTLIALAAINAIVITWAAALDARNASALARALGATPGEVTAGLSAAQVLPAFAGAVLGVPGGLALWATLRDGDPSNPTFGQLLAVVAGTVLVVAGLTAIPARIGARRPAAEILQSELA